MLNILLVYTFFLTPFTLHQINIKYQDITSTSYIYVPKVRYTELCGGFLNETAYHQPENAELNLISVKCRVESGFHSTPFKQTGSPLYQHHFEFYFHIQMLNAE